MKNELASRLLVGSFGMILTSIAIFAGFESTLFILIASWTFIFLELSSILELSDLIKNLFFFFSALLWIGSFYLLNTGIFLYAIILCSLWLLSIIIISATSKLKNHFFSFLLMIYFTIPFSFLIYIRKMNVPSIFFLLFLLVWTLDVFSYFFGITIGKHLIAPKISPKKTWEGTFFGVLFSFGTGILCFYYVVHKMSPLIFLACLFIPIFGFLGDLFESSIKRKVNKKDSSSQLLGHGGYLDRFDSLLFVAVFFGILLHFL